MSNQPYYLPYPTDYDGLAASYGHPGRWDQASSLPSSRSMMRGLGLVFLVISTCWGSYLQETGTGFATAMSYMSQILVILLGAMILASVTFTGTTLNITTEFLLLLGFLFWTIVGFPLALSGELARIAIVSLFKLLAMALIILNAVNGRQTYQWLLAGLVLAMIFASAGAITGLARGAEIVEGGYGATMRYSGTFGNANEAGRLGCLGAWAAFTLALVVRSRVLKVMLLASVFWGVVIVGWTGSKQALLALFIGALCAYWFVLRKSSKGIGGKTGWLIVFAVALGAMGVYFGGTFVGERVQTFFETMRTGTGDRSDLHRLKLFMGSLRVFVENPILGVGYGCVGVLLKQGGYISPHNTLASIAAETGLPGWLAFFGAWLVAIKRLRRLGKLPIPVIDYKLAMSGWILFAMMGFWTLTGTLQTFKPFWVCFAGLVAYLAWVERAWREAEVDIPSRYS